MTEPTPIQTPSGYAPAYAVGYADTTTNLILVSQANPLPVSDSGAEAAPPPLTGETSVGMLAGPFAAAAGRVVTVTLSGTWSGTATLRRSTDGGVTTDALRVAGEPWAVYDRPGCEQAWLETEAGATYYLDVALDSGTLAYRVSQ